MIMNHDTYNLLMTGLMIEKQCCIAFICQYYQDECQGNECYKF